VVAILLINVLRFVLLGLWLLVLARVLLSYVDPAGRGTFARLVLSATEPILRPIRRILPRTGMLDLSPLILCIGIGAVLRVLV
jgi:YggT family protein